MSVAISGISACTPVGLHAAASCAAFRAGLAHLQELFTHSVDGELFDREPMVGGRVPTEWLKGEPAEEKWPGHERFGLRPPPPRNQRVPPGIDRVLELCSLALEEVRFSADLDGVSADRFRVYLGLNEAEPADRVIEHIQGILGGEPSRYVTARTGRASGLALLHQAVADIEERRAEGALVGGVDSLIRKPVAERYDRLHRLRARTAPEGFLAGEAAAFVYIEPAERAQRRSRTVFAHVSATGVGSEPSGEPQPGTGGAAATPEHGKSNAAGDERGQQSTDAQPKAPSPNTGHGLSQALRSVREAAKLDRMPLVVCDLNGERPRAQEWMLACTRVLGDLHGELELWHPAECIGDVGAAAGIVDLVWAAMALHRGYAPRKHVLVWGASDQLLRAAAVLTP